MRAAVKFCQISKVIGMYLSELLNVFVKFHICDACLSNSARSQGSSEWEGVCFVRRGVKISRARQVSVYININTNTNRWWFKYKYKILFRQYNLTNTFLPAEIGLLDGEVGMPKYLENLPKRKIISWFYENTCKRRGIFCRNTKFSFLKIKTHFASSQVLKICEGRWICNLPNDQSCLVGLMEEHHLPQMYEIHNWARAQFLHPVCN